MSTKQDIISSIVAQGMLPLFFSRGCGSKFTGYPIAV